MLKKTGALSIGTGPFVVSELASQIPTARVSSAGFFGWLASRRDAMAVS